MHSVLCNKAFPPISSPVQMDLGFIDIHTSLFGSHGSISSLLPGSISNKVQIGLSLRQYEDLLHLPDAQAAFRQGFLAEVAACAGAFAWLVLGDVRGGSRWRSWEIFLQNVVRKLGWQTEQWYCTKSYTILESGQIVATSYDLGPPKGSESLNRKGNHLYFREI